MWVTGAGVEPALSWGTRNFVFQCVLAQVGLSGLTGE
jgi:hypothetical protein